MCWWQPTAQLVESGEWAADPALLARIRMKPVRTLSGVTTVTVLTKPYPCPGKCIFCPTDVRMPKSYLPDEPGAMRGLQNDFDPYAQVRSRLAGAGSDRPPHRQDRAAHPGRHLDRLPARLPGMVRPALFRCRLNERFEPATLEEAQPLNETAAHRNVGLVIETRPDEITPSRAGLAAHAGRDQGADGRAEPG